MVDINLSQANEIAPQPGLSSMSFRPGVPVTITATGVQGTASAELVWRPENDGEATITPAGANAWSVTPDIDIMPAGGSYRIKVSDDRGGGNVDVVYRTFSIMYRRTAGPMEANLIDGLAIPSPMETGDNAASLANAGPEPIFRSESNAPLESFPSQNNAFYTDGSPWGWWRYLRDITRWLFQPQRMLVGDVTEAPIGTENLGFGRGGDYCAMRANTLYMRYGRNAESIVAADKGIPVFATDGDLGPARVVFGDDGERPNVAQYLGVLVDIDTEGSNANLYIQTSGLAVVSVDPDTTPRRGEPIWPDRDARQFLSGYNSTDIAQGVLIHQLSNDKWIAVLGARPNFVSSP